MELILAVSFVQANVLPFRTFLIAAGAGKSVLMYAYTLASV